MGLRSRAAQSIHIICPANVERSDRAVGDYGSEEPFRRALAHYEAPLLEVSGKLLHIILKHGHHAGIEKGHAAHITRNINQKWVVLLHYWAQSHIMLTKR